jgi:hypothetical protein
MLQQFIFNETSPAAAGTAVSKNVVTSAANYLPAGVAGPVDDSFGMQVTAVVGNPVGGTLDLYVQTSPNDGGVWFDQIHFSTFTAGLGGIQVATLSAISQPASAAPVTIGTGLTPALAAGIVVQGTGFNRLRLVMVASSGTTAGASVTVYVVPQRNGTRAS